MPNRLSRDSASSARVVVAVPSTGSIHQDSAESIRKMITATMQAEAIEFWWDNDHPHDRCRNALIARFMDSPGWTHLLFVDTDVTMETGALDRLLAHRVPIVCAPVPTLHRRYGPPDEQRGVTVGTNIMVHDDPSLRGTVVDPERADAGYRRMDPDDFPPEPFTCDATGLGLCLIERGVFERVDRPWCSFVGQFADELIGEDVYFFRKARNAGFEIVVDPSIEADHLKQIDLTHLDLLYSDKIPVSSWPRLQEQDDSRWVCVAVRVPRTGWLSMRLVACLQEWERLYGDRILIERIFADTVRGGFVQLAEKAKSLDSRFGHVLILGDDVVPHRTTLGLMASVDAPIVSALTRSRIDGQICWGYWNPDPLSGALVAPQNIKLEQLTEPFGVASVDPACVLIRRGTLACVADVARLPGHGPQTDLSFGHGWCKAVTTASGQPPVVVPMTVERRCEVGLLGMLQIKMRLKSQLRAEHSGARGEFAHV